MTPFGSGHAFGGAVILRAGLFEKDFNGFKTEERCLEASLTV
jgi:hypothetical protein